MKKLFLFLVLLFAFQLSFAQKTPYEVQRRKINRLLEQRSAKFGQYDESLKLRTGIFGLKTKKDMQRSIDILREIVTTDNTIFKELKVLLDYKDLERNEANSKAEETENRIKGYMQTITKLQQENDRLKQNIDHTEKEENSFPYLPFVALAAFFLLILFLVKRKN